MTTSRTVTVGGKALHVERVSARKASRAMALLRHINKQAKGIAVSIEAFERDYQERNLRHITRPEARVRFPPQVVLDPTTGAPVREPERIPNPRAGELVVGESGDLEQPATIPNPRAGDLVTFPSAVDRMSEEDWQATGGLYPVRERAPLYAIAMHAFEDALEVAEEHVYRLLALFAMSNADVARLHKAGNLEAELTAKADEILDEGMAEEILELAVVCGEVVDQQFTSKARELGDRLGNALRLFGLGPSSTTSSTPPSGQTSSTPSSSTDSPSSSEPDGPPTSSSTPTTASSSESDGSPTTPEQPPTPTTAPAEAPASEPSATSSAPATTTSEVPELAR